MNGIRQFLINNGYDILCIASYENISREKHRKLAQKYAKGGKLMILEGKNRDLTVEEQNSEYMSIINTMYAF